MKIYFCVIILFLSITACRKEKINNDSSSSPVSKDYRADFTGRFKFMISTTSWSMVDSFTSKTAVEYTLGSISLFKKDQLLIKYNIGKITGIWIDTSAHYMFTGAIKDTINNEPELSHSINYSFWGYYWPWVTPILDSNSIMKLPQELLFSGRFINKDSLILNFRTPQQGSGAVTEIYGKRY